MKKVIKNQLAYWFPIYAWAVLIFYFSATAISTPISIGGTPIVQVSSYYKHLLAYGFLTFLLWRAFYYSNFKNSEALAVFLAVFYGSFNEVYQHFIPGRFFSLFDISFNLVGCILVQPLILLYKSLKK